MKPEERSREFKGRVVVITGASAGVGRAAALAFARAGARLGLIARDSRALKETVREIKAVGGRALFFAIDVADARAVADAAAACERSLGPIDVWVNNAMVTVYALSHELTAEEVEAVTATTYLGSVHGTLAALKFMRPRNNGVIVQVGSALAYRGIPLQAAYCAAKHALRGFTDSLRGELLAEGSSIRLAGVHLPAINTPQFDWARTHESRLPRPVAPVYQPEVAARAILKAARRPAREYWVGIMTPLLLAANMIAPRGTDRYLAATAVSGQARRLRAPADRPDNLHRPVRGLHRTRGSFSGEAKSRALCVSEQTARTALFAGAAAVATSAGVFAGLALARRRHRTEKAPGSRR